MVWGQPNSLFSIPIIFNVFPLLQRIDLFDIASRMQVYVFYFFVCHAQLRLMGKLLSTLVGDHEVLSIIGHRQQTYFISEYNCCAIGIQIEQAIGRYSYLFVQNMHKFSGDNAGIPCPVITMQVPNESNRPYSKSMCITEYFSTNRMNLAFESMEFMPTILLAMTIPCSWFVQLYNWPSKP